MNNTFTIGSVTLRLAREFYNEAYHNERSLEVALGRWFLDLHSPPCGTNGVQLLAAYQQVVEVGCVLPYYGLSAVGEPTTHEVIDISDEHPASRKVNALSLDYTGRNVLSISSVEHFNGHEYGNASDEDSITFLKQVTAQAANYLVTWGVGYNAVLDTWVRAQPATAVPRTFMKRLDWQNRYGQVAETDAVWATQFGHSDRPPIPGGFNNANVVAVVTNLPELLPT